VLDYRFCYRGVEAGGCSDGGASTGGGAGGAGAAFFGALAFFLAFFFTVFFFAFFGKGQFHPHWYSNCSPSAYNVFENLRRHVRSYVQEIDILRKNTCLLRSSLILYDRKRPIFHGNPDDIVVFYFCIVVHARY